MPIDPSTVRWDSPAPAGGLHPIGPAPQRLPPPQTPAQAEGTVLNNQQTRTSIANTAFDNADKLRTEFQGLSQVKQYTDAANALSGMLKAPDNGQGDLQTIYAFAKIMDPGSVVREGEMQMANDTASIIQNIERQYGKISEGNRLPPEVRRGLIESARQKMSALNETYGQSYKHYRDLASQHGFDPEQITGPFIGDTVRPVEEQYIRDAGGTPRHRDGTPVSGDAAAGAAGNPRSGARLPPNGASPIDPEGIGDIGFNNAKDAAALPPGAQEHQRAFQAAIINGEIQPTAESIMAWVNSHPGPDGTVFNLEREQAERAADGLRKGIIPQVTTPKWELSDDQKQRIEQAKQYGGGMAFGAGAADTLTMGAGNKLIAILNAARGRGDYGSELRVANEREDAVQGKHPWFFGGGQVAGAAVLPTFGAKTVPEFAKLGAAYGAAHGAGSSDSFAEAPANALGGAAAGASVPVALGGITSLLKPTAAFGARKIFGEAGPEELALLRAGADERVPINMGDVYPTARNSVATLESIPGSSGPIREGIEAGRNAMETRVGDLGRGGQAMEELDLASTVQGAGRKFVGDVRKQAKRLYGFARREGDGVQVIPDNADRAVTKLLAAEEAVPGGTKAGAVIRRYAEAFQKGEAVTIDGARKMRSELASSLRTDGGLTKKDATRITGEIMGAVNKDIEEALSRAGKVGAAKAYANADRFYAQAMDEIDQVTERFIGSESRPKTPGQTLSAIQTAIGRKGDPAGFKAMFARLSPDERKDFAATVAENLGRRSADEPFSPATFISNIRNLNSQARRMIFGDSGERSIQNLMKIAEAKKETVARLNNSRSGQVSNYRTALFSAFAGLPGGGALLGLAQAAPGTGAVAGGALATGTLGLVRSLSRALMNEEFTRLVANAPATSSPQAINAHFGKLRQLASKDPNVRAVVERLEQKLLEAANDNLGGASRAAANPETEQQNNQ